MKRIKSIPALLTAMTMTIGAMGITTYADEKDITPEQQVTDEEQLLYDEEEEQIDENDEISALRPRIVDPADVISRYILDNEIDASLSQRDGYVEINYLDKNAKTAIEKFIAEKDYDKTTIKLSEMSERDKCRFVLYYKLIRYMEGRRYHSTAYMKKNKDGSFSVVVNYYLGHEDFKDKVEKYLSEKGYDKQVNIEYEFIGDKDFDASKDTMVRKRDKIEELLKAFIEEKGLHCDMQVNDLRNTVALTFSDVKTQKKEEPILRSFMTEKHIDQSIVCVYRTTVSLEELDSPDLTIVNTGRIYRSMENYAKEQGMNVHVGFWAPEGSRPDHDYILVRYLFQDERIKLEEYAEKMGYEKGLISFGYMSREDTHYYVTGKVSDLIYEKDLKGFTKGSNDSDMCIVYRDTDTNVRTEVEKYMKENKYDTTGVTIEFLPVNCEVKDPNEPVTDRNVIFLLLNEYIRNSKFRGHYASVSDRRYMYFDDNEDKDGDKTYVHMTVYYDESEMIDAAIRAFIKDKNLKVDDVEYTIYEGHWDYSENLTTLKGDADLNGLVELADLTTVAKYVLSPNSFPLKDETAFANADMNNDGDVNGIDVSMLIEQQLGKKKSEPAPEPTPEPEPTTEPATEPSTEFIPQPTHPDIQPSTEVTEKSDPVPIKSDKTIELTADLKPVSVQAAEPSDKFNNSQIDFALSLLKNTKEENTNTLVSPYSAAQALAMTANGAKNNTLKELMSVIGGGMDIDSFNKQMAGLNNDLPNDENCKLLTANSIWYHNNANRFYPYEKFLAVNKSCYDAQIFSAPMNDETVKDVNSWVNKHTDGMIPSIIDKFGSDAVMALVNAVTFDAKWAVPYDKADKRDEFFVSAENKKQDAEVMSDKIYMPYLKDNEATGFLKYYKGGRYAFAAILPNEGTSVTDYIKELSSEKFSALIKSAENKEVLSQMPKFSVDYSKELNDTLKAMGIKDAFDVDNADFSNMGKAELDGIHISKVLQKTHIDVDEDGTKAAAATSVEMGAPTCAPVYTEPERVILNRPFVYAIVDTQTNIPIFIGTLNTLE